MARVTAANIVHMFCRFMYHVRECTSHANWRIFPILRGKEWNLCWINDACQGKRREGRLLSARSRNYATTLCYEIDVKFKKRQDLMEFFFSKISRSSTRERRERERERENTTVSRVFLIRLTYLYRLRWKGLRETHTHTHIENEKKRRVCSSRWL